MRSVHGLLEVQVEDLPSLSAREAQRLGVADPASHLLCNKLERAQRQHPERARSGWRMAVNRQARRAVWLGHGNEKGTGQSRQDT